MNRDRTYVWSKLIVGINIPRSYWRSLNKKRFYRLALWVQGVWLHANDNDVLFNRPSWLPKKYPIPTKWGK